MSRHLGLRLSSQTSPSKEKIHKMGTSILLVELNISRALTLVDRAYVLERDA
jgi:ABC-type branched-subunit amino acid transport system ATPase component